MELSELFSQGAVLSIAQRYVFLNDVLDMSAEVMLAAGWDQKLVAMIYYQIIASLHQSGYGC